MIKTVLALKRLLGVGVAATAALGLGVLPPATAHADTGDITMRIYSDVNPFVYLGVADSSTGPGGQVIQRSLSGDEQIWTRRQVGAGAFEFVNKNSGLCMYADGVAGHGIYQEPCDGDLHELFATNMPGAWGHEYPVESRYNPQLYWDMNGASRYQGTHLVQWYRNGGSNQYFGGLAAS